MLGGSAPAGVVDSCWTNGSLLLNRPNEISWLESRWTTTWSVFGSLPAATTGAAPGVTAGAGATASGPFLPPIILGSSKPRTASRTTDPTAMKIFWRRTRFSASDLTDSRLMLPPPSRR